MATLTIKVDATTANATLSGMTRQIELMTAASKQLSAVWQSIPQHITTATVSGAAFSRTINEATKQAVGLAGALKTSDLNLIATLKSARDVRTEFERITKEANAAAAAARQIRTPARSGSGGTFTTGGATGFSFSPSILPNGGTRTPSGLSNTLTTPGRVLSNSATQSDYAPGLNVGAGFLAGALAGPVGAAAGLVTGAISEALKLAWTGFKIGATTAAASAAAIVGNSIRLAIKDEPVRESFRNIAASKGLGDQAKALEELREAARGTVSDIDLMTGANRALQLGAASSTSEISLLVEAGRRLAKSMGIDATEGFNRLVTGIGKGEPRLLDELGLVVKRTAAYEDYAKSVGTTSEQLSEAEKLYAFQNAALAELAKKMNQAGEETFTTGDKIDKFQASFSNFSASLGATFLPAIGSMAERWAEFLDTLNGNDVADGLNSAINSVKGSATSALDFIFSTTIAEDFGRLGADVWSAFTDPSIEAFKIVGLGVQKLMLDVKTEFVLFFENATSLAKIGASGFAHLVGTGLKGIGLESAGSALQSRANAATLRTIGGIAEASAPIYQTRAEGQSALDAKIEALRQTIRDNIANRPERGDVAKKEESSASSRERDQAAARAEREREAAAARAVADSLDRARIAINFEIRGREEHLRLIEGEISKRRQMVEGLEAAQSNARAALEGRQNPTVTLSDRLNAMAEEFRKFPNIIANIGQRIAESGQTILSVVADNAQRMSSTFGKIESEMQKRAFGFLAGGPQDGETVRVRSIKRRFQRDLNRQNTGLVNDAFRSPSLDGLGINPGIFGAQNVERAGSITNQRFPALELALAQQRDSSGSSALLEAQRRIADILNENTARLKEAQSARLALLDEEKNQLAAQEQLQKAIVATDQQAIAIIAAQTATIAKIQSDQERTQQQLEGLRKALEEVARRAKR